MPKIEEYGQVDKSLLTGSESFLIDGGTINGTKTIDLITAAAEMFKYFFYPFSGNEKKSLLFVRNGRSGSDPQTAFRIGTNISASETIYPSIPKGEIRAFIITGNEFWMDGISAQKTNMSFSIQYQRTSSQYTHYYTILSVGFIDWTSGPSCLTGDTLVTMADGSQKRIDEICIGDEILSYDWETLALVPNRVIFTDKDEHKMHDRLDKWTFEDGTVIKTVHRHEFYNAEALGMQYMDKWQIGEHALRMDGTKVALVSHETILGDVQHYKITGEKGTNYFANGLLTGDRECPKGIKL